MVVKTSRKKWIGTVSKLHSSYSISFDLLDIDEMFWSWILKNCILVEKKEKEIVLLFTSSMKHEIRKFHIAVVRQWQRNVHKSLLLMQSCCFANLNLLLFCHSCCCSLSFPLYSYRNNFPSSALSIFFLCNDYFLCCKEIVCD